MKITETRLRQIIKEEIQLLREQDVYRRPSDAEAMAQAKVAAGTAGVAVGGTGAATIGVAPTAALSSAMFGGWLIGRWLDNNGASLFDDDEFEGDYMQATKEMRSMGSMEVGRAIADALGIIGDNEGAIFAGLERLEQLRSKNGCAPIRRAGSAGAEQKGLSGPREFWQGIYDSLDGEQRRSFTQIFAGWGNCTPPNFRFNQ